MTTSFARDIAPVFAQYQTQMMWRFDLTSYDAVKGNAELIFGQIKSKSMPPPPFEPLSDQEIQTFEQWMKDGCPQ